MAKGHWSFLHEWVIYDYILARAEERTLRFRQIIKLGKLLGKPKWIKVDKIKPITGTSFPDVQGIKFKNSNLFRPAEVKFTTSLFGYHKDIIYESKFKQFVGDDGFILVASHDQLPRHDLLRRYPLVEVYELEIDDFITFCRENFSRLLNRQIRAHTSTRIWLMYQGPNFNIGIKGKIAPARQSMRWCPTENLTGFDLTQGDRVLFYKTSGLDRIKLQNKYLKEGIMDQRWILREIFVAEVTSKIFSRSEYDQHKKHTNPEQLWKNDPVLNDGWRWNRVFEFVMIKVIKINIPMSELVMNKQSAAFGLKAWEAFCYGKSRELSHKDYRDLLEVLV